MFVPELIYKFWLNMSIAPEFIALFVTLYISSIVNVSKLTLIIEPVDEPTPI